MLRGNGVTRRVGVIGHIFVVLVRLRSVGVVVLENGVEARIAGPLGIIGLNSGIPYCVHICWIAPCEEG